MSSLPRSWTQYYNKKKRDDQLRRPRSETGTGTITQTSPGTATSPQGAKTPKTPTFGTPTFQNTDPEFQGSRSRYFLTEEQKRGMSPEQKQALERDPSRVAGTEGWSDPVTSGMHRVDMISTQKGPDRQQQRMDREDFRQSVTTQKQARDHASRRMDMEEATHEFDMIMDLHRTRQSGGGLMQTALEAGIEQGWTMEQIRQVLKGLDEWGYGDEPVSSSYLDYASEKFGPPREDPNPNWKNVFQTILTPEQLSAKGVEESPEDSPWEPPDKSPLRSGMEKRMELDQAAAESMWRVAKFPWEFGKWALGKRPASDEEYDEWKSDWLRHER